MIQIITCNKKKFDDYDSKYKISSIDEFDSFDDYNINIIDLSEESLWRYSGMNVRSIDRYSDLKTLEKELSATKKSKIIIIFPQNCLYKYAWIPHNCSYDKSEKIKDMLPTVNGIISRNLTDIGELELMYSRNKTIINGYSYKADFNLNEVTECIFKVITKSDNSNKVTTAIYNDLIFTTLDIFESNEHLNEFLKLFTTDETQKTTEPEWIKNINFYNDEDLKIEKIGNQDKIKKLEEKNKKIDDKLEQNNKFKSVLYTTGDELVEIVMKMLDDMLEYDSSDFVDEKKEDFLIKKEDVTFVGEIKGISSAIGNKNVSQLDVHVQGYIDKILNQEKKENVKGLLIINHQRNKEISARNEVHQNQIDLAVRNSCLIIESTTLLYMYELYLQKKIDTHTIEKILTDKVGVLQREDLK